ncbi:MAG: hypothetical protein KDA93_21575 [Planctomycetaceae bacterium]|nr:hypothetical protein [Planctomycetaceae bacterium]
MAKRAASAEKKPRRKRTVRPFPACSFKDALELAEAIQEHSGGQPIRRLTLFDTLGKAPDSGASRQLITNSSKYGLTTGSYSSDMLELTPDGATATSDEATPREKTRARVKLAIQSIEPFNSVYEKFVNNKLPSRAVLIDAMKDADVSDAAVEEAVDTFLVNAQTVGVLQTLSGAERFVTVDHLLDTLPAAPADNNIDGKPATQSRSLITANAADFATTCFYVTPIGSDDSEHRKHSDLFLGSLVEPALEQFGLKVVRADAIEKPGLITKQVIEYLLRSRLVVADLSFHNPNVFYELAIRHAARLPTVQITRKQDHIPFDVNQNRTVQIDCTDIYSLVPQLETYRSQIANQARRALEDADASDNPITLFWPSLQVTL